MHHKVEKLTSGPHVTKGQQLEGLGTKFRTHYAG